MDNMTLVENLSYYEFSKSNKTFIENLYSYDFPMEQLDTGRKHLLLQGAYDKFPGFFFNLKLS